MPAIVLNSFTGTFPARSNRLLADNAAVAAVGTRAGVSSLEGVNDKSKIDDLLNTTRTVFRIPTGSDLSDLDQSFFMQFTDVDTDVARTPVINDQFERYYWANPTDGLQYNTKARIINGDPFYDLGVPQASAGSMSVTPVPGTGDTQAQEDGSILLTTRSYTVTFVSAFGEEGQPSVPIEATGYPDQAWSLAGLPTPTVPTPSGQVPIVEINIYRTVTDITGVTAFYRVDTLPAGTTTYLDNLSDATVSANGDIESDIWAAPPDMDGLIAMPNGIFVGFKDNNLYFSENYRPHAWPAEYTLTVEYPIVGLGVFGSTCVVCTTGHPVAVTGVNAGAMTMQTFHAPFPCLSRGSIVSSSRGVVYASQEGLVLFGPSGVSLLTASLIGRNEWQENFYPSTVRAALIDGRYVGVRNDGSTTDAFMLDLERPEAGIVTLSGLVTNAEVRTDVWSGKGLLVQDEELFELLPGTGTPVLYRWRSKEFQSTMPVNFAVGQVHYVPYTGPSLGPGEYVGKVRVFADGSTIYDQEFRTAPGEAFRLPSGFKARVWQIEIEARVEVHSVAIATSMAELRNV